MGTLLLLLFIIFILWPLIKIGWRIWSQMQSMRRFMADPEGEMRRRQAAYDKAHKRQQQPAPEPKKKKIARDVGEYIEYTEIELTEEQKAQQAASQSSTTIKTEEQITDIKWVDIK